MGDGVHLTQSDKEYGKPLRSLFEWLKRARKGHFRSENGYIAKSNRICVLNSLLGGNNAYWPLILIKSETSVWTNKATLR